MFLLGLTCYLNAVIQALLGQSNFNLALLNCGKFLEENSTNESGKLLSNFIKIAKSRQLGDQELVRDDLYNLRKCLKTCLPQFGDRMQDAHEFLIFFCDTFSSHLKEKSILKCPFNQTFQYQLTETKQCVECSHKSSKPKKDFILRLDMPTGASTMTIQSLLKKTLLDSNVDMSCSSCGVFGKHENMEFFNQLPQVLIVYLPRSLFVNEKVALKNRKRIDVNPVICLKDHVTPEVDMSKLTPSKTAYDALWPTDSPGRKKMIEKVLHLSSPESSPEIKSKLSLTDKDINQLSEEEQMKLAMANSISDTTPKKSANDALWSKDSPKRKRMIEKHFSSPENTPEKKSKISLTDIDINNLSEEEQMKLAKKNSLVETSRDNYEEDLQKALEESLEESMKGTEGFSSYNSDDDEAKNTIIEVKGETRAKGEYEYQLTSTINHIGGVKTAEIGHYIADVYHQGGRNWFRYNDERVFSTNLQAVLQKSTFDGCLFFYTHKNVLE